MMSRAILKRLGRRRSSKTHLLPASFLVSSSSNYSTDENGGVGDSASTAVIGGGVVGTSIAYHLAKQGEKNVVLLEKSELTAGSTWHAAGLTTSYQSAINVKKIHFYSLNMYSRIASETGQEVGFHQPGSIRIATISDYVEEFQFQMAKAGIQDAPQTLLSPKELKEKVPLIREDKVVKGLYTPQDGHIDPYSLTQAIAKGARNFGASIEQGTEVTSLNLREDGKWEVGTDKGVIVADRVVNAAGFWAKEVGRMAGLELPLIAIEHQYLVTSSVPEIQALEKEFPVLRLMEASCYVRQERDGFLVGTYESPETMKLRDDWVRENVPSGFGKELFPSDLDRMTPYLERVMEVIPSLASANITSVVNGPITYTPESLPMVGPSVLPNLWLAVGFGYGIIQGGGVGKFLADWIQNGEPSHDLMELDPGRFGDWTDSDYVTAKARESYGMNNAIAFPHEERFAGRPTRRKSTAYDKQVERGASMAFGTGWENPAWFAQDGQSPNYEPSFWRTNWHKAVEKEWTGVKSSAGVVDLTPFGKIVVEGPQASSFLQHVTANKVPSVGKCVVSHMLTPRGRVYSELTVTQTEPERFLLVTGAGSEIHDLRWLERIIGEEDWDVGVRNASEELGCLSVAGPSSRELLSILHPRFASSDFPFFAADKVAIGGTEVLALRLTYTGELGWELYHPRSESAKLYEAILEAGSTLEKGLVDFGSLTLNVLRSEKGFRLWGKEMNHDTNIVEAGLLNFVDLSKENFVGKTAVEEILKNSGRRKLIMLKIDPLSQTDPHGDESVWLGGKVVGSTTSGCFSYKLNQPLAFAYLPPFLATPGTKVQVELMGELHDSEVLTRPPDAIFREKRK